MNEEERKDMLYNGYLKEGFFPSIALALALEDMSTKEPTLEEVAEWESRRN